MARLINGRKVLQMSAYPENSDGSRLPGLMEVEHRVTAFFNYLPAGPLPNGSVREHDLIQFFADPGGLRTVRATDIVIP
jgi:hypothetical protein